MDANEKLNTIKHNQIQNELNELKSKDLSFAKNEQNTVYNNKKIYDHFNEKLHKNSFAR